MCELYALWFFFYQLRTKCLLHASNSDEFICFITSSAAEQVDWGKRAALFSNLCVTNVIRCKNGTEELFAENQFVLLATHRARHMQQLYESDTIDQYNNTNRFIICILRICNSLRFLVPNENNILSADIDWCKDMGQKRQDSKVIRRVDMKCGMKWTSQGWRQCYNDQQKKGKSHSDVDKCCRHSRDLSLRKWINEMAFVSNRRSSQLMHCGRI